MIEIHYKGGGIINIRTLDKFERDFQAHMKQRRQKSA
jgi:ATP-dependent Clp protease adapter protein ClpS